MPQNYQMDPMGQHDEIDTVDEMPISNTAQRNVASDIDVKNEDIIDDRKGREIVDLQAQEHMNAMTQNALDFAHGGNDTSISHRAARRDIEQDHVTPMVGHSRPVTKMEKWMYMVFSEGAS